jgi:hypothetical protein
MSTDVERIAIAKGVLTAVLRRGPALANELERARRLNYIDEPTWTAAKRALTREGVLRHEVMWFDPSRREQLPMPVDAVAVNRRRHRAIAAKARAWAPFIRLRDAAALTDMLDCTYLILREFVRRPAITLDELLAIAQAKIGVSERNFEDALAQLRKTGIFRRAETETGDDG